MAREKQETQGKPVTFVRFTVVDLEERQVGSASGLQTRYDLYFKVQFEPGVPLQDLQWLERKNEVQYKDYVALEVRKPRRTVRLVSDPEHGNHYRMELRVDDNAEGALHELSHLLVESQGRNTVGKDLICEDEPNVCIEYMTQRGNKNLARRVARI